MAGCVGRVWWRGLVCVLVCVLVVCVGRTGSSGGGKGEVFAVLVGVGRYQTKKIQGLKYAERDVRGVYDALTGKGRVPRQNVRMLLDKSATRRAIRRALRVWLRKKLRSVKNQANVLVYFSGRGYAQEGISYWLPYDAEVKNTQSIVQIVEDTGIGSDQMRGWLSPRFLKARAVAVFVDACDSRPVKGKQPKLREGFCLGVGGSEFGREHTVIMSSEQGNYSLEVDKLKHGVFSYVLIKGLKGEADLDRDGKVTLGEVWLYLSDRVPDLSRIYTAYKQTPIMSGIGAMEMVLSRPGVRTFPCSSPYSGCIPCESGKVRCGGGCVDVRVDALHCGGCGKKCLGSCSKGLCVQEKRKRQRVVFVVMGVKFVMRWIPAGSFMMGSPSSEPNRGSDEGPQRRVRISKGFWMLESEVTQEQYKALMGYNLSRFSSCGDNCPVEQVNWHEARAFADKLSAAQGLTACTATDRGIFGCKGWRLPTEAEWEYAARAGTTKAFHAGDCISTNQANYDGNYPQQGCAKGEYREKTIEVCSLAQNAWGLCDVHGNVYEWTMDWYKDSYSGLSTRDPLRSIGRSYRVMRGGSWGNYGWHVRSALRDKLAPALRRYYVGFRLLRSP